MSQAGISTPSTFGQGRYEVKSKLGEGGMAFALLAFDKQAGVEVVLKVPKPNMMADPDFVVRFRREIRSMQKLAHEHIVKIRDAGEEAGTPFFVMDLLAGGSLEDRLEPAGDGRTKPMPPGSLADWLEPVASALDFIHQHYVHRDIKPSNILFDAEGNAYVSDFGIVKAITDDARQTRQTMLTQTGMAIGTAPYMAPELCEGRKLDGRADQYALAATVYQALAGRVPFEGSTLIEVLKKQIKGEIAPLPGLPRELTQAILKGLSEDPQRRHATCTAFARAVLATLQSISAKEPRVPNPSRAVCPACRKPFALPPDPAGKRVQCPACGSRFTVGQRSSVRGSAAKETAGVRATPPATIPAATPAPRRVAKTASERSPASPRVKITLIACFFGAGACFLGVVGLVAMLFLGRHPREEVKKTTLPPQETELEIAAQKNSPKSPPEKTGSQVVPKKDGPNGFKVVPAKTDDASPYDLTGGYRFVHFGPGDGVKALFRQNIFLKEPRAWVVDTQTRQASRLPLTHRNQLHHAAFSPDGKRVVTASQDKTAMVWDVATGQKIAGPLAHQDSVVDAAFSPDGKRVVTASLDKTAVVWDAESGQKIAGPFTHERAALHAAFSPDGKRLVTSGGEMTAIVWDVASGQKIAGPLTHQKLVLHAAFSPDGKRVVTASGDEAVVWDAANGQKIAGPLTHQKTVRRAAFSPDGKRVVTASFDKTAMVWDAASGQKIAGPLAHLDGVVHAAFSPDGKRVVTASWDKTAVMWDVASGQQTAVPLTHLSRVYLAAFSPDAKRVVTLSDDNTATVWDAASGAKLGSASMPKDK